MARATLSRKPRVIQGFSAEQSAALFAMFRSNDDSLAALATDDVSTKIYTEDLVARPGQFIRIAPPDSRGVALLLPAPESTQPRDRVTVSLESPLGDLRVSCVPNQGNGARVTLGTVNGLERATFTAAGMIEFTSNGATGWTTAAEHPAESAATPGITPTSSTEILPSNPSGSIWTWALRPFSVILGRLAKQAGLTVIGNATDALAAVSAVTATAPRQALLVNSAGTAIGWRAVEAADLPASSPWGWDDVLANDATSNGHNPIVSVGDFLQCGAAGPTTGNIRSGDAVFQVHGSAQVNYVGDTAALVSGNSGNSVLALDSSGMTALTASSQRLLIAGTGQWTLGAVAGSSGQFIKHQGAANPTWASLALSDLPSQAADTFLGRLAGSGTPTAQLFSDIDSASLVYDAVSHTFQLAAGTGDITWSQNSTATTIAANAVTNTKLRDSGALSVIGRSANSSGDPADISATAASGAVLRESGSAIGFGQVATAGIANNAVDDTKLRQGGACSVIGRSANSAGNVADISATINDRILSRVSNVVGFNQLSNAMIPSTTITKDKLIQSGDQTVLGNGSGASASPADLTLVEPLVATVNSLTIQASSRMGMIKEDVDALGSLSLGYRKSRKTHWFHDDFDYLSGTGAVTTTGLVLGTGTGNWFCQAVGASGSIAMQTAENNHPGILRMTTGATNGNTMRICKGSVSTTTWIRGDEVEILEVVARLPSTASVGFFIGMTDLASNQLAFSFDTATDTTIHVLCTEAGVTTDTDTNVAPGTDWDVYMIRQTTAGTVEFLIDDVVVATVATNIPDTETLNLDIEVFTRTAAAKSADIDYVYFQSRDLGARTS